MLEHEPAFCIQVDRHRGRTFGHGASAIGVSEPGGEETGLLATGVVEATPPVGVLGMHLPSLSSSVSLHDGAEVVATGAEAASVVLGMPPVGVFGTHLPSFTSSESLQGTAEVVATRVVVVTPPVGVLGTHEPFSFDEPSEQSPIAAGVEELAGGVGRPPVGVLGTHLPSLDSSSSLQVGGVGRLPSTVVMLVGGASPHFGQNVAVDVMVVVETVWVTEVMLPLVIVTGQVVKVVTTISVVTRSELAGGEVIPPVGV